MKTHFALVAAVMTMAAVATAAQPPIYVSFDTPYNIGNLAGQEGWNVTGSGGPNPIAVVSPGLSYSGYQTAGGAVFLTDTGEDLGLSFDTVIPAADGNTYYYSLMLTHDGSDVGNTTGDYFAHFTGGTSPTGTAFRGRLFGRQGTLANNLELGLRFGSADTVTFSSIDIAPNTTAFAVVKITEVAGANNDTADLFVFTAPNLIPVTEPGTAAVSISNTNPSQDIADGAIGRFGLRQGMAAQAPKLTVDEIRIGTTWADILPATMANVPDWDLF
jgi:hypothetical protein